MNEIMGPINFQLRTRLGWQLLSIRSAPSGGAIIAPIDSTGVEVDMIDDDHGHRRK